MAGILPQHRSCNVLIGFVPPVLRESSGSAWITPTSKIELTKPAEGDFKWVAAIVQMGLRWAVLRVFCQPAGARWLETFCPTETLQRGRLLFHLARHCQVFAATCRLQRLEVLQAAERSGHVGAYPLTKRHQRIPLIGMMILEGRSLWILREVSVWGFLIKFALELSGFVFWCVSSSWNTLKVCLWMPWYPAPERQYLSEPWSPGARPERLMALLRAKKSATLLAVSSLSGCSTDLNSSMVMLPVLELQDLIGKT